MKSFTKASLVADALNLGPHWIYNQTKLARLYPNGVTQFTDPASDYHPNRKAGQLTHSGDQLLFFQESIENNGKEYNLDQWRSDWIAKMSTYDGYIDNATQTTLANSGQQPSDSDEISGAARLSPLLDLGLSLDETIQAAKSQTGLTHGATEVLELSEFIVRAAFAIREGQPFKEAFQIAASHGQYRKLDPITHLEAAQNGNASDHLKTSADFGLTCHFADAFPLVLFYALHFGEHFAECLSLNALAGGDNTARAMMLAIFFAARDGDVGAALFPQLNLTSSRQDQSFKAGANPISFTSSQGQISGVLELPETEPIATAIFAHCFTCGKDFLPEKRITQALAERGIATLRIDFSGIGSSDGDFAQSSFLTNLDDLSSAAKWLSEQFSTPEILIGHSLGGAAVLAAAKHIPSVKAVATIGAPADPAHVTHLFENHLEDIEAHGEATVRLAGRPFTVGKRFLDDLKTHQQAETLSQLKGISTLIMHAPQDDIVPLKNAGHIYSALQHPKSFISLAGADHLLTQQKDAEYVADLIKIWSSRSLEG